MTNDEKKEFKQLVKEGAVEALESEEGKKAVVSILGSDEGKQAIVSALKTQEAKEVFIDNFAEAFNEVAGPVFEGQENRIKRLERKAGLTV